jgi:hypothetical protein
MSFIFKSSGRDGRSVEHASARNALKIFCSKTRWEESEGLGVDTRIILK